MLTHNERTRERTLDSGCLEDALPNRLSNGDHTYDELRRTFSESFTEKKSDEGFFHNALIQSIFIDPQSTHVEYMVVSEEAFEPLSDSEYEAIYKKASVTEDAGYNEEGKNTPFQPKFLNLLCSQMLFTPFISTAKMLFISPPAKDGTAFIHGTAV